MKFRTSYYDNKLVEWFKEHRYESLNTDMIIKYDTPDNEDWKSYLVVNYQESQHYKDWLAGIPS